MLPLQGILVAAIEQAVAAPFATRQVTDLGTRHQDRASRGTRLRPPGGVA
jgi:hypothetical protein